MAINEAPPLVPPPKQQENEEISCKEMLKNLLTDETLKDIWLKGTDGGKVGASRITLAARSLVFRRMLFGEFSETGASEVPIGFHSTVLKAIVEYIHTDTAEILEGREKKRNGVSLSLQQVHALVSLIGAAMYFQFPGLSQKAKVFLKETLTSSPSISFAVLEACQKEGPSVPTEIKELAWKNIRGNVDGIVLQRRVGVLSASLLEDVLKDDEMEVYEFQLFQLLQQWANGSFENAAESTVTVPATNDRNDIASDMAKHIKLERIDATFLSTEVALSGLVSQEQLFEAYKQQALAAQKEAVLHHNWLRKVPVWKTGPSGSTDLVKVKTLDIHPVKSGTYRWTMLVEEKGSYLWLGIQASPMNQLSLFTDCAVNNEIGIYENGEQKPDRTDLNMLKFGSGSKVTFALNLTPNDNHSGTLCASVDGEPIVQLFSGLQDRLDGINSNDKGFIPAFSFQEPTCVRLLNIEKMD